MRLHGSESLPSTVRGGVRQEAILESALGTFARYGYRKTSMEEVAQAAGVSRQGLYFLFSSKEALFRAAAEQALQRDIDAVAAIVAQVDQSLQARLLESFDLWAGRYVGPLAQDIIAVIDENPELLGSLTTTMPQRFEDLIVDAITPSSSAQRAREIAQTLISTSKGVKYEVDDRSHYRDRIQIAISLIVP